MARRVVEHWTVFLDPITPARLADDPELADEIDRLLMAAYRTTSRRDRFDRWLALQPDGWVVARTAARSPIVGCGGFIAYADAGFGWIGLIAVAPASGRAGIGRSVTQWCVDELKARGCGAALDGSAQGAPLYARMGFAEFGYSAVYEFAGEPQSAAVNQAVGVEVVRTALDMAQVIAFDSPRFGADRGRLLSLLDARYGPGRTFVARTGSTVRGYVVAQDDSIGPLVADDATTASALIRAALALDWSAPPTLRPGPEVQRDATTAVPLLEQHGFALVRTLRRQHLGVGQLPGHRLSLWAAASFGEG